MKKTVTALLLLCACAFAEAPSAVAIRNAKIVRVSGPAIAKGTVILRNGLIEAVGENLAIPADAWVVEGEGLTVYPGLIDALSTVGMPGIATPIGVARRPRWPGCHHAVPPAGSTAAPHPRRAHGSGGPSADHQLADRRR